MSSAVIDWGIYTDGDSWELNVVVGLGAAGTAAVEQIDTDTVTTTRTAADSSPRTN